MQAIIYLRVSTSGQAEEGVSLAAQEEKARTWCSLNDYLVKDVFVDAGLSGGRADNRPGLQNALLACGNDNVLVVYSLSRLARSTRDTIELSDLLTKKGCDLVSLSEKIDTTSASGKMIFRLLAVMSEFERDQISERTSFALQHKKSKGELVGFVPYGSSLADDGIHLIHNETEAGLVCAAKKLKAQGCSLRQIASGLLTLGFKPRGKEFYPQTIKFILAQDVA
ncbi:recombinase family protein [Methylobacter sp. G7]|uniref:recombinase family protein n=1 Tax=Methylobacter sp. G7 TaxID=3230117 RepID=UPI003D806D8C